MSLVFPLIALMSLAAFSFSGCAHKNPMNEPGRDNYFGGLGYGGNKSDFVPREVQRVEPAFSIF